MSANTCEAPWAFLYNLMSWILVLCIFSITTENVFDFVKNVKFEHQKLSIEAYGPYCDSSSHTLCTGHAVYNTVKHCLVHSQIDRIRPHVITIRSGVKQRDVFDTVKA